MGFIRSELHLKRNWKVATLQKEVVDDESLNERNSPVQRRLTTLRVSSEAENEEPQPQNKRGK